MDRFPGISIADERAEAERERRINEALDELTAVVRNFCFFGLLDHETAEAASMAPAEDVRRAILRGIPK